MQWDPIVLGAGILGSAIVGAMIYSFEAGREEREIKLKLEFLTEQIQRVDTDTNKRIDNIIKYQLRNYIEPK